VPVWAVYGQWNNTVLHFFRENTMILLHHGYKELHKSRTSCLYCYFIFILCTFSPSLKCKEILHPVLGTLRSFINVKGWQVRNLIIPRVTDRRPNRLHSKRQTFHFKFPVLPPHAFLVVRLVIWVVFVTDDGCTVQNWQMTAKHETKDKMYACVMRDSVNVILYRVY
jgi:hypothetical protein